MSLIRKLKTLAHTRGMLGKWIRWNLRHAGVEPCVRLPSGDRVCGFRSFSEFWGGFSMIPGESEVNFIKHHAGKTGVVLDVGANMGCMALTMSRLRPGCMVHAFEPSPETFAGLQANLRRNQATMVVPQRLAAGRQTGRLMFLNDQRSSATNRLLTRGSEAAGPTVEVDVVTLDDFLGAGGDEVAFLKVDVEGYEPDVLLGARHLLTSGRCKAGLVELCPGNLREAGYSVQDLLSSVAPAGWCLHHLNKDGGPGAVVTVASASGVLLENVALLPKS